jgi:hypothetical protein
MSTLVSVTNHGLLVRRFLQLGDGANVECCKFCKQDQGVQLPTSSAEDNWFESAGTLDMYCETPDLVHCVRGSSQLA